MAGRHGEALHVREIVGRAVKARERSPEPLVVDLPQVAGVAETEAAARSLDELANELRDLVGTFRF